MKFDIKGMADIKIQKGGTVKFNGILYVPQSIKNLLRVSRITVKRAPMGSTKYKVAI